MGIQNPGGSSSGSPTYVVDANPNAIYSGQVTVTTSAQRLPSQVLVNGVVLTAPSGNSQSIAVGPAGVTMSTGYVLVPGQSISYGAANLNDIYYVGQNTADKLNWTGN